MSNLGQWEKEALFPSSDFIAKNRLARECSQSVSPVIIPGVIPVVDRQFKEDRTPSPLWALSYYLDCMQDLWGARSLLFISFKNGWDTDWYSNTDMSHKNDKKIMQNISSLSCNPSAPQSHSTISSYYLTIYVTSTGSLAFICSFFLSWVGCQQPPETVIVISL